MKLRPLLVLLLFVVSAGILVWIYYAATTDRHTIKKSPWAETLADLDACCQRKHVKSVQYDHFARVAWSEERSDAANLFRAMAFSERLGEQNCADAILRLGGSYRPPVKVAVFHSATDDNLSRSIAYEQQALGQIAGSDIRRAFDRNNRYVARILIWAAANDMRHIALMQACRSIDLRSGRTPQTHKAAEKGHRSKPGPPTHKNADINLRPVAYTTFNTAGTTPDTPGYLVCPTCGNTYVTGQCDAYCPFCLTDRRSFIEFR